MTDLRFVDDLHCSSRARSNGMLPTAMPPAFTTASQQAASIGELAPRSSTRLPLHQAQVINQHMRDAIDLRLQIGIGPAHTGALHAQTITLPAFNPAVEQLAGAVEPVGPLKLGQVEHELGQRFGAGSRSRAKVSTWVLGSMGRILRPDSLVVN